MPKYIYVSGPYTKGDVAINVRNAMEITNSLIILGYVPYCPHLSHFMHMAKPISYEDWLFQGMAWLVKCDAMIVLPGKSIGVDLEIELAREKNIPVFTSLVELLQTIDPMK
jgi:hypothetical protein